jgi:hypothetical protein
MGPETCANLVLGDGAPMVIPAVIRQGALGVQRQGEAYNSIEGATLCSA